MNKEQGFAVALVRGARTELLTLAIEKPVSLVTN